MKMPAKLMLPVALVGAMLVTLLLFLLMQSLISPAKDDLLDKPRQRVADFLMPAHQLNLIQQIEKPEKPELVEQPPMPMDLPQQEQASPDNVRLEVAPLNANLDIQLGGIGLGTGDGEYLPLVRPPPVYPRYALKRGLEGYVIVEFTVTQAGAVISPRIIEGNPPGVFDNAALQALKRYKYKPKMVDGAPVNVAGVRQKFTFKLDKS
jgi:protein TonB